MLICFHIFLLLLMFELFGVIWKLHASDSMVSLNRLPAVVYVLKVIAIYIFKMDRYVGYGFLVFGLAFWLTRTLFVWWWLHVLLGLRSNSSEKCVSSHEENEKWNRPKNKNGSTAWAGDCVGRHRPHQEVWMNKLFLDSIVNGWDLFLRWQPAAPNASMHSKRVYARIADAF